ncbi:hypothetical protein PORY_001152 [Pneumocystis oryctolagi]|uniref:Uncharacterized protein n=1 Tax=Pneumocystis oryctolagi TaxID=42067 RepID=A0ACB7CCU6_9ASCO|nr:hypothetical protein PORY_001152 [Pneumocystis oryctolagi]
MSPEQPVSPEQRGATGATGTTEVTESTQPTRDDPRRSGATCFAHCVFAQAMRVRRSLHCAYTPPIPCLYHVYAVYMRCVCVALRTTNNTA